MIAVIAPLFAQILCSNASKAAIVTAWVLTVAFFNAGHWIVGASSEIYVYINLTFLFVMYSSYEIESSFVERFLLTKVGPPVRLDLNAVPGYAHTTQPPALSLSPKTQGGPRKREDEFGAVDATAGSEDGEDGGGDGACCASVLPL